MADVVHAPKIVQLEGSPDVVLAELEQLHGTDKKAELVRVVAAVVGIAGVVFGFLLVGPANRKELGFLLFGLAVVAGIVWYIAGRSDVEDRKLECARELVQTFREELRPGRPVELYLNFKCYWKGGADDPWLDLRMVLANSVSLQVRATQTYKRKTKRKRKYTKVTDKIDERFEVRLVPPRGQGLNPGQKHAIPEQVRAGQLRMVDARIGERAARFVFRGPRVVRVTGRSTLSEYDQMPAGFEMVRAVIASYHLLGESARRLGA